jgi:hypothetical protein
MVMSIVYSTRLCTNKKKVEIGSIESQLEQSLIPEETVSCFMHFAFPVPCDREGPVKRSLEDLSGDTISSVAAYDSSFYGRSFH